jgi:hypothetical protein
MTLRQYDLVSRLAPKQQGARIAALNREIKGAQIAAKVIDEILEGTKGASAPALTISSVLTQKPQRIDLALIARKIIESIRSNRSN